MRASGQIVMGGRRIATQNFHVLGPGGGTWWVKYSWWVIPLGVVLLVLPAVGYWSGARVFSFSGQTTTSAPAVMTPQPIVVTPVPVVIQSPPPPALTTPSALGEAEEAGVKPPPKPKSLWELNP
ncbi:MAG: hypothetical protein HYX21_02330 [Candidatus Yanofskybacteria bacterium]|nr:hypothetical protein [Candidatus Yanofskybacteria bacterium]